MELVHKKRAVIVVAVGMRPRQTHQQYHIQALAALAILLTGWMIMVMIAGGMKRTMNQDALNTALKWTQMELVHKKRAVIVVAVGMRPRQTHQQYHYTQAKYALILLIGWMIMVMVAGSINSTMNQDALNSATK